MNNRRKVLYLVGASVFATPLVSHSQQQPGKMPRIGYLNPVVPENPSDWRLESFQEGLRELGYVDGKNVHLEVRWGQGKLENLPKLAAELVQLNVDVIVAATSPAVNAAKQVTRTIPIVMPFSSDPVGDGLVASLARPGGNITGLSMMAPELGEKRLQLLREVQPNLSHFMAVLWNPAYTGMAARYRQAEVAASGVGVSVRSLEVKDSRDLEAAFDAMARAHAGALLLLVDPFTRSQKARIIEFAAANRIPAIYEVSEFVEAGGLMSYGPNVRDLLRRSATYVDKILRGAKPGDLPIEQPTKFELMINMKTAKSQGIKIPQSILLQADKVIE